jgi:hypothetical protein
MTETLDTLPSIGAPATRALHAAGYSSLRALAGVPRSELAGLHGVGPKALRILEEELGRHGLALA